MHGVTPLFPQYKMDLKEIGYKGLDLTQVTHGIVQWYAFVYTVMNNGQGIFVTR
jgi:hypothetical protein